LHAALAGGHRDVTELLLVSGAEVNAKQHGGYTALHAAAFDGDPDLTRLLLANGADASLESDGGQTALAIARERAMKRSSSSSRLAEEDPADQPPLPQCFSRTSMLSFC
jgi:ankyrin repeat protein